MFKVVRYIIIFVVIMICLFLLQKNNIIENTKTYFNSLSKTTKVSSDDIYNRINSQDFMGGLSTTSVQKATTVKAYVKDNTSEKPKTTAKISIDGIIHYTNLERQKVGLKPLIKNLKLNNSASKKTDDMFTKQYFEHLSPDGTTAADLVKSVDYQFLIVGENLALGIFETDQTLVQAWMNSPTHKANILNSKYTEIGAAVGIGDYKSQKQWMAVQHFAKPMPMCLEIDKVVQSNIDLEKTSLELEERELQKMAGVIESDPSTTKEYLTVYNTKVSAYNDRLNKLRETIVDFNKTIVDYNLCIKV